MKKFANAVLLVAAASLACTAVAAGKSAGEKPLPLVSFPVSSLQWKPVGDTGIKVANARGDILSGKPGHYDAFVLFPNGRDNGLHTHSYNLPTVVMAGTFYAIIDGKRTEYPAGSFYNLPANMPHESGCVKGPDCLLFQYQAGGFDLIPVKK